MVLWTIDGIIGNCSGAVGLPIERSKSCRRAINLTHSFPTTFSTNIKLRKAVPKPEVLERQSGPGRVFRVMTVPLLHRYPPTGHIFYTSGVIRSSAAL
jgi:hypothetical protein